MGALWGALTSMSIAGSDLFGRRVVHAGHALTAALAMQLVAAMGALAMVVFVESAWNVGDIGLGALSGFGVALGLTGYYAGIVRSAATLVAPVSGTLSAVLPFAYAIVRGQAVSALAVAGGVVAFVGLAVIGFGGLERAQLRRAVGWAIASGVGYALSTIVLIEVDDDSGVWPAVSQRGVAMVAILVVVVARGVAVRPPRGFGRSAVMAGVMSSLSSVLILLGLAANAAQAVVTASLYPALSVLVGFAFFGDGVTRTQIGGLGLVVFGVVGVVTG